MKTAFCPIINKYSKVLILGTMPSEESLRKGQYYGHRYNQFWHIMFAIFDSEFSDSYEIRVKLLQDHSIALWDVLQSCEGEGSADSDIRNERPNNFTNFYRDHPNIKTICFSSKKAADFYRKYIGFGSDKTYYVLPSPSSANARMKLADKIEIWKDTLLKVL